MSDIAECEQIYEIDRLLRGELSEQHGALLLQHIEACPECAKERHWLQTEMELVEQRRSQPLPEHIWQGVEAVLQARDCGGRAGAGQRISWWQRTTGRLSSRAVLVPVVAVAVLFLVLRPSLPSGLEEAPRAIVESNRLRESTRMEEAQRAIRYAQKAHQSAFDALEVAYHEQRPGLGPQLVARYDEEFRVTRVRLRELAQRGVSDVHGQRILLASNLTELHNLQTLLEELPGR